MLPLHACERGMQNNLSLLVISKFKSMHRQYYTKTYDVSKIRRIENVKIFYQYGIKCESERTFQD